MKLVLGLLLLASSCAAVEPAPAEKPPTPEHAWLHQLVGEWSIRVEAQMGPNIEPARFESHEVVRPIGATWILAEGNADYMGSPFTSLMTLGYDSNQQAFVGTWVDTMQPHLWTYRGSLDESRRVLTLEAEGPSMDDPSALAKYRDSIEIVDPSHRILRSAALGADGQWTQFMKAEYTRR